MMKAASGAKMTKVSHTEISESIVSFTRPVTPLGLNARRVISKRYSLKDSQGNSIEEWSDIVARVVAHVSVAETDPAQRDLEHQSHPGIESGVRSQYARRRALGPYQIRV